MTTVSVNWELAPEGTTHFLPENADYYNTWIKKSGKDWFVWYDGDWNESYDIHWYENEFISKSGEDLEEEKQIEWDGKGLPPVGTLCEVMHSGHNNWVIHKINYMGSGIVVFEGDESDEFACPVRSCQFRPIRTPEQVAEEEREKAIEEMMHVIPPGDINSVIMKGLYSVLKQAMIGLYDAGYRKEYK